MHYNLLMKKLPACERARILHLLCEGSSIRAVTRLTGASKKSTVIKLTIDAGKVCAVIMRACARCEGALRSMRRDLELRL
jgi:hypothetical protein